MELNTNNIFNYFERNLEQLEKLATDYMKAAAAFPQTEANQANKANKKIEFDLKLSQISELFRNYTINFHEFLKQKKAEGLTDDAQDAFFKDYGMSSTSIKPLSGLQNRLEAIKHWSSAPFMEKQIKQGEHINLLHKIQTFIQRGGKFNSAPVEGDNLVIIRKSDINIPVCQQGWNRSQTLAGVLRQQEVNVNHVIAGGAGIFIFPEDEDFPDGKYYVPPLDALCSEGQEDDSYEDYFKMSRIPQEETGFNKDWFIFDSNDFDSKQKYKELNKRLQEEFFNRLEGKVHFITFFSPSILSLVTRIMQTELEKVGEKEKIDLSRYTITYFNWPDSIMHPPAGIKRRSYEAYAALASKLLSRLIILDS